MHAALRVKFLFITLFISVATTAWAETSIETLRRKLASSNHNVVLHVIEDLAKLRKVPEKRRELRELAPELLGLLIQEWLLEERIDLRPHASLRRTALVILGPTDEVLKAFQTSFHLARRIRIVDAREMAHWMAHLNRARGKKPLVVDGPRKVFLEIRSILFDIEMAEELGGSGVFNVRELVRILGHADLDAPTRLDFFAELLLLDVDVELKRLALNLLKESNDPKLVALATESGAWCSFLIARLSDR